MIAAIMASTSLGGIGNRGTLPWPQHSEDMAYFKQLTENNIVIMGRKTWDDVKMPKPLPDRINCVVSNTPIPGYPVRRLYGDVQSQIVELQEQYPSKNIYIIGGKQIYELCEDTVNRIYITRMSENWWADTRLNLDKMLATFQIKTVTPGKKCTFEIWDRTFRFV